MPPFALRHASCSLQPVPTAYKLFQRPTAVPLFCGLRPKPCSLSDTACRSTAYTLFLSFQRPTANGRRPAVAVRCSAVYLATAYGLRLVACRLQPVACGLQAVPLFLGCFVLIPVKHHYSGCQTHRPVAMFV